MSLNFMGENREVAEVGLNYMTVTEVSYAVFMWAAFLLAAVSRTNLPFMIVNGACGPVSCMVTLLVCLMWLVPWEVVLICRSCTISAWQFPKPEHARMHACMGRS